MKPKTMILMVVAVTCGLGASYMTSKLLAERKVEVEKVRFLVLRKPVSLGDSIKNPDEYVEDKEVAKDTEPKGAIADRDLLKGKVMKRSLRVGDHLTLEDLLSDKDSGIQAHLPPGFKAVGVRVNPETIAGGFASLPNSRVDIFWTCRRATDKDTFAKVLLEDVLVIAADANAVRPENGQAMPASVVSLALNTEDALKLSLAKENGTISLVLRKFNDKVRSDINQVNVEALRNDNVHKSGDVKEDGTGSTDIAVAPTNPTVKLPEMPKAAPKIVAKAEPVIDTTTHVLKIVEGDKQRHVQYQLDKDGQVVNTGVTRSELGNPPRPEADVQPAPSASAVPQEAAQPKINE
ncbi:MAG: Flp pilus assembly protein CpaB [Gemmataceae bacterium]